MWTINALVEALGQPDERKFIPVAGNSQINLPVIRWRCESGSVRAFGDLEGWYTVEADCEDQWHKDLQRLADARVRDAYVYDDTGQEVRSIPGHLNGVYLKFRLDTPAPARVRVEAYLDATVKLRPVEEFDVGAFVPGSHEIVVPLYLDPQGPGAKDGPARQTVELRIEILDIRTGRRDWGAHGVPLYRKEFKVALQ
jgi:hypothetical protein